MIIISIIINESIAEAAVTMMMTTTTMKMAVVGQEQLHRWPYGNNDNTHFRRLGGNGDWGHRLDGGDGDVLVITAVDGAGVERQKEARNFQGMVLVSVFPLRMNLLRNMMTNTIMTMIIVNITRMKDWRTITMRIMSGMIWIYLCQEAAVEVG